MLVTFEGTDNNFIASAWISFVPGDVSLTESDSTSFVFERASTGVSTTVTGRGFTYDADGDVTGGTAFKMEFSQMGETIGTFSNMRWDGGDLFNAIEDITSLKGAKGYQSLLNLQPIIGDASKAGIGAEPGLLPKGHTFDHEFIGSRFGDKVFGGKGDDMLSGNRGADKLSGKGGADILDGGKGKDQLTGNLGKDTFVFKKGYGKDTIKDFQDDKDTIQLDDALWGGGLSKKKVINKYADVVGDDIVFDFGKHELKIKDFTNLSELRDDIDII